MLKFTLSIILVFMMGIYCFGQSQNLLVKGDLQELRLIKKPAAKYTDRARQKRVEGWVKLTVTFLANGEIGEVIYVSESSKKKKKLTKYGLVDEAIAAARQIKFEPARESGQPITVVKIVEYNFDIY